MIFSLDEESVYNKNPTIFSDKSPGAIRDTEEIPKCYKDSL